MKRYLACNAEVWELDDDERWEVLVLRQDHFDEVVPNIYSPPADQYISAHTDQSHLLGETSDILSLTLGSAGVFSLCSEIRKMVLCWCHNHHGKAVIS